MAVLSGIQTGTCTITGTSESSKTATITSIDKSKSLLLFTQSFNAAQSWAETIQVDGEITNATTLTFTRGGFALSGSDVITIRYWVLTWSSGVTVQHGRSVLSDNTTPEDITITSVDTTKAWPIVTTSCPSAAANQQQPSDFVDASLTSATNLRIAWLSGAATGQTVSWQVIEYDAASVQTGTVSFASGDTSKTATITSVTTAASALFSSGSSANANDDSLVRGTITDATTLTFNRGGSGTAETVRYHVVSFSDGTNCYRGSIAFGTADTSLTGAVTSVDTARAVAHAVGNRNTYGADATTSAVYPRSMYKVDLTNATTVTATRGVTGSIASDVNWQVIEFNGAAAGPTITDVNTDEALSPGETATITGTGFGASQGAGGVAITQEAGAVSSAVTITGWSDTSITGTVNLGGLSYGATTSLVVTDNAAATGSIAVTFVPAAGYSYVTLSGYPHATAYVVGEGASPALVDGDQVEYESVASSGATVTVNADGSFTLSTTDPANFDYRVRDNTDNTWSDWATIYVNQSPVATRMAAYHRLMNLRLSL